MQNTIKGKTKNTDSQPALFVQYNKVNGQILPKTTAPVEMPDGIKKRANRFIGGNSWRFATTYAKTAPHEYLIYDRLDSEMQSEYLWFMDIINKFGVRERFYRVFFSYLYYGEYKYWIDDGYNGEKNIILNRADRDGGLKKPQNPR